MGTTGNLLSPGVSISVNNQTQNISSGPGTIPLIFIATAANKIGPDGITIAPGTQTSGTLYLETSQTTLTNDFGNPIFEVVQGTVVQGSETSEYGLHAAYSCLGIANQAYVIRADIDLAQLAYNQFAPTSEPENGSYWFNLTNTSFGIFQANGNGTPGLAWNAVSPLLPGTANMGTSILAVGGVTLGTATTGGLTLTINSINITTGTTLAATVGSINASAPLAALGITGTATANNQLELISASGTAVSLTNSHANTYFGFGTSYSSYAPSTTYGTNGQFAVVTETTNNTIYQKINGFWHGVGGTSWRAALGPTIATGTTSFASGAATAGTVGQVLNIIYEIGANANGTTITYGTTSVTFSSGSTLTTNVTDINAALGSANVYGITAAIYTPTSGTNYLQITNVTGVSMQFSGNSNPATLYGLSATLGYNFYYSPHTYVPNGTHTGDVWVKTTNPNYGANYVVETFSTQTDQWSIQSAPFYASDALASAGYGSALQNGVLYVLYPNSGGTASFPIAQQIIRIYEGTSWSTLTYTPSATAPTNPPVAGQLWISNNFVTDIMVNTGSTWEGYLNKFPTSDANGVQITSAQPTTQSTGSALVQGDLWLNSDNLIDYPQLYRWTISGTSGSWQLLNNTDTTSPFGIIFADARNTADGTEFGATGTALLTSNYCDEDCPNPEVYPAGMLLFNTRVSTYNVKEWNPTYFSNITGSYYVGSMQFAAPSYPGRWVTASGNQVNGAPYMGRFAQHIMVVNAFEALMASNQAILSDFNYFNLMACPNYPELDLAMENVNIERNETAFIINDTPMHLLPDATSIQNWATNADDEPNTNDYGRTVNYTYSAEYYPQGLGVNTDGNQVAIPASTIALRTYLYNDSVSYPWVSPAGVQRGIVQNATSVGYVDPTSGLFVPVILNQGQRNTLYTNSINPISFLPSYGLVVYGDKSLEGQSDALSRINVCRLVCYLRYNLNIIAKPFLFQLNTVTLRSSVESIFSRYMGDLMGLGAITDFAVVCDNSNNTVDTIAENELNINIAIVPSFSIDFIYISLTLVNTLQQ